MKTNEMQTSESGYQGESSYSTFLKIGILGSLLSIVEIFMASLGYSLFLFQNFIYVYLLNIISNTSLVLLIIGISGVFLRYRSKYTIPIVFLYLVYKAIAQHVLLGEYSFYLYVALNLIIGIMLITIRNDVQNSWLLYGVSSIFVLRILLPDGIRLFFNMVYPSTNDFVAVMFWWSPMLIAHTIYCTLIILLLLSEVRPGFLSRNSLAIEA